MANWRDKERTIQCGITAVPRVFVKRESAKYRQNATVFVGAYTLGQVYESLTPSRGKWVAENLYNQKVPRTFHKTAVAAVKALVCGQIRSERTSRKLQY